MLVQTYAISSFEQFSNHLIYPVGILADKYNVKELHYTQQRYHVITAIASTGDITLIHIPVSETPLFPNTLLSPPPAT